MSEKDYTKPQFWKFISLEEWGDFSIVLWIPEDQIEQLIRYSQNVDDTALLKNTGDFKRFSSRKKFEKWYNDEGRHLFCMLDKDWEIAWIWWGRPAKLPTIKEIINQEVYEEVEKNTKNIHTSAIRIYPKYRGKWLVKTLFLSDTHYKKIFSPVYMSVDIEESNKASQKSFERQWYIHFAYWSNVSESKQGTERRMIYIQLPKK